jgi:glycopeptide antibiotics resistance protein
MPVLSKSFRILIWVFFIACMLVLAKFILFKKDAHYYNLFFSKKYNTGIIKQGWKNANLKPFHTIRSFYNSRRLNTGYKMINLGGNIIGFIPLGILLPLLFSRLGNGWKLLGVVFLISFCFELIQLLFGLGAFDVDDMILNSTGGVLGYILYRIALFVLQYNAKG